MQLRALFAAGEALSVYDIADRLQIAVRSAARYLESLKETGFALYEERQGKRKVWRQVESGRRFAVPLSLPQMIALCLSRQTFDFLAGTGFREDLDELFAKLQAHLGRKDRAAVRNLDRKLYDVNEAPHIYEGRADHMDDIVTALLREERLEVTHESSGRGQAKRFLLDPYTLVVYRKGLYLIGRSHAHDEVRTLAVDGFREVRRCRGDKFEYPVNYHPKEFYGDAFGIIAGPRTEVRIWFSSKVAPFVRRRRWHRSQSLKSVSSGGIELTMSTAGTTEVVSWILGFGPEAEVLEPAELRESVGRALEAAAERYMRS
jgi:proteasome accessory factor B